MEHEKMHKEEKKDIAGNIHEKKQEEKKTEEHKTKHEEVKKNEKKAEANIEKKQEEAPKTEKKDEKKIEKKDRAFVKGLNMPISMKDSKFICKFIKGNRIEKAIEKIEKVIRKEIFVPMIGEIPHRKKGQVGRYPQKAGKAILVLLKSLTANANVNGIENPIITNAMANHASRPYKRHGSGRAKRTHVYLEVGEEKIKAINENKTLNKNH